MAFSVTRSLVSLLARIAYGDGFHLWDDRVAVTLPG